MSSPEGYPGASSSQQSGIPQESEAFGAGGKYGTPDTDGVYEGYVPEDDLHGPTYTEHGWSTTPDPNAVEAEPVDDETASNTEGHTDSPTFEGVTPEQFRLGVEFLATASLVGDVAVMGSVNDLGAEVAQGFDDVVEAIDDAAAEQAAATAAAATEVGGKVDNLGGKLDTTEAHNATRHDEIKQTLTDNETARADDAKEALRVANESNDKLDKLHKLAEGETQARIAAEKARQAQLAALHSRPVEQNPFLNGYMSLETSGDKHMGHLRTSAHPAEYPTDGTKAGTLPEAAPKGFWTHLGQLHTSRDLTSGEPQLPHILSPRPDKQVTDEVDSSKKKSRFSQIMDQRRQRRRPV